MCAMQCCWWYILCQCANITTGTNSLCSLAVVTLALNVHALRTDPRFTHRYTQHACSARTKLIDMV
jgi:hypothetical protein